MRRITFLAKALLLCSPSFAQTILNQPTGKFSGIQKVGMSSSTNAAYFQQPHWDISMMTLFNEHEEAFSNIESLKKIKKQQKLMQTPSTNFSAQRTAAATPSIGNNFEGNQLWSWTPSDNSVAISNDGRIVSVINFGYAVYDTIGTPLDTGKLWKTFVNDTTLKSTFFDPRVLYDNKHDRFILVLLHGFTPTNNRIVVCFSKTNNPLDGWNIYKLSGNPFNNNAWTDFPTIGINDDELFINGNQFGGAPTYDWKGSYIYQVGLQQGYLGDTLITDTWSQILAPNGTEPFTMYPASDGQGRSLSQKMYFVHLAPDLGSNVYVYRIDGLVNDSNKSLTASQYQIPPYEVCADAYQKDTATGIIDSLSTGSAAVQNAFLVNNTLHYTQAADVNGWCGIHYGRIDLINNTAQVATQGLIGTDLAYPAGISFGYDSTDNGAVITFVRSDTTILPEVGVVSVDSNWTWAPWQTVKTGDTVVDILHAPQYPTSPERWGDYSGMARKFNSSIPEAWLAASYAANTAQRTASYSTWIAQIKTNEVPPAPLGLNNNTKALPNAKIYPNPAQHEFTLEFKNEKSGNVNISLFDITGKLVTVLFEDYLRESLNRLTFNKQMLLPGTYVVLVKRNGNIIQKEKLQIQ